MMLNLPHTYIPKGTSFKFLQARRDQVTIHQLFIPAQLQKMLKRPKTKNKGAITPVTLSGDATPRASGHLPWLLTPGGAAVCACAPADPGPCPPPTRRSLPPSSSSGRLASSEPATWTPGRAAGVERGGVERGEVRGHLLKGTKGHVIRKVKTDMIHHICPCSTAAPR